MTLDKLRTEPVPASVLGGPQRFVATNGTLHGVPAIFLEPIPDAVAREPGTVEDTPADETRLTPGSVAIVLGHPGTAGVIAHFLHRAALTAGHPIPSTIQARCQEWLDLVTHDDPTDLPERVARFFEEATEWVQALGMTEAEAEQVLRYVFARPIGEPAQEAGGMLTTAMVLAQHVGLDLLSCGEAELERVFAPEMIEKIRGKRSRRHGRGPLPGTTEGDLVPRDASRFAQLAPDGRAPIPEGYEAELKPPYDPVRGWMAPGCCSASSPCGHQKRDPHSICATCRAAAPVDPEEVGRDEVLEAALDAHQNGEE